MVDAIPVGTVVADRYRVEALLGRGGFGAVYRAVDVALGRVVALKVLFPDDGRGGYRPATQARAQRELEVLARLRDPHTVTLFAHGVTSAGHIFMVFEYLDGRDLSAVLDEVGTLPPAVVVHVMRQLLASLAEAHGEGLLHRDLKPQNVRVFEYAGDPWRVKLLDFGIARATAPDASVTATGELVGTPRYMSPEQLTERPLTPASDIYGLGMMAVEMIAGTSALPGARVGEQLDRLHPDFALAIPAHAGALGAILEKMTRRDPDARFPSAQAVLAALAGPVDAGYAAAPAESARPRVPVRSPRTGRYLVGFIAAVGLSIWAITAYMGPDPRPSRAPGVAGRLPPGGLLRTAEPENSPSRAPLPAPDPARADEQAEVDLGPGAGACWREPPFHGLGRLSSGGRGDAGRWLTYIPTELDPAAPPPLLLLFHDDGVTARDMVITTGFAQLAEQEGFVIIAPEDGWVEPWDDPTATVPRVRGHVEATAEQLCIETPRVFVAGQGAGGAMAARLGCEPWVAAVMMNSHRPKAFDDLEPHCARWAPLLTIDPTRTGHVPLEGGKNCRGYRRKSHEDVTRWWRTNHGCAGDARPVFEGVAGGRCTTWSCEVPFVSCVVDGGFGWPGTPARLTDYSGCDGDPPAFATTAVAWEFLSSAPAAPERDETEREQGQ